MITKKYLFYIAQNYAYAILRPLQKVILARGDSVAWFLEGDQVDARYLCPDEIQLNNIHDVMDYHPYAVFVPGNNVPTFIPGMKVAVFHGFNSGKLNRRGWEDHFNIRGCFDLYCTQGPNTTKPFIKLAKKYQHFSIVETGWSAIDPLFNNTIHEKNNKPTILMCSTFSRKLSCAAHLFETIKTLSQTGKWQWLIQFHPKMSAHIVAQYKTIQNEYLTFVETDNVIPLLQQADVMVCDTSSVLMMFLLLNKPVVTFKNIAPKNYLIDINDGTLLEKSINVALSRPSDLMANIATCIKETHPYIDGKSSQRVLDATNDLFNSGRLLKLKKKPLNLLRNFKIRKKLNYWS